MDESQPVEVTLQLSFQDDAVRKEFIRLFKKCLTSRDYGMEHRMDHNRDLMTLRLFMKDKGEYLKDKEDPDRPIDFELICEWLDYAPDDARRRIARAQTWDMIRDYLDSNGSSVSMPGTEAHVDALFALAKEQRGPAWEKFYKEAIASRMPITTKNIKAWIENYTALPAVSETEEEGDPGEISFEEESEEETEISQADVPQGTKTAVAVEIAPGIPQTQTPGTGPTFRHPTRVREAIETIAKACAGKDTERLAEWTAMLSDPVKIEFQSLLDWADHTPEDIRRIASLATGNLHKGLRTAMRIVEGVIDSRTTLNFLVNRCRAEGGRLEHAFGPYTIVVTYEKAQDYESGV
jgi:hypothetical protein